jgi:hypothetical protein
MAKTPEEKKTAQREYRRKYHERHPERCREADRKYREQHKDEIREKRLRYYKEHSEEICAKQCKYFKEHPEQRRKIMRKHKYGLLDGGERLLANQGGVCAICGGNRSKNALAVDHNHVTGEVCGFLCLQCNAGLGCFADNSDWLRKATEYNDKTRGGS